MEIKFHMQVRCQCGWALEEDKSAVAFLGTVTVMPCPVCCKGYKRPETEDTGKINRRGVMVDERST